MKRQRQRKYWQCPDQTCPRNVKTEETTPVSTCPTCGTLAAHVVMTVSDFAR